MSERTVEEIIARIEQISPNDFFGFEQYDLIEVLPFDAAKPFLEDCVTSDQWEVLPKDRESVLKRMQEYMPFAWEKANDCRGISAGRSLSHFQSWIWLAGDDLGRFDDYQFYGKDELVRICDHYGWDAKQWDDGIRSNTGY